jgi:hypothetical protein
MRLETVDLSKHIDGVAADYKRLSRTQLKLLSSQVPESFVARFADEKTALKEMLDVIYGTDDLNHDDP